MSINLYKKKTINNQPVLEELLSKSTDTVDNKPLVYDSTTDNVKSTDDLNVNSVTASCFYGPLEGTAKNATCFNEKTYSEAYTDIRNGLATQACADAIQNCADFIQSCVSVIEEKIPAQASASNQLADKDFVNSSITTNTANFRGTYSCIDELPSTGNTNNDYAFVCSLNTTTGNYIYDRYKWVASDSCWVCEYELNTTGFTAEQLASINSGITSNLVSKITDVYDNTIEICMNNALKGSFSLNQNTDIVIDLGCSICNANYATCATNATCASKVTTFNNYCTSSVSNNSDYNVGLLSGSTTSATLASSAGCPLSFNPGTGVLKACCFCGCDATFNNSVLVCGDFRVCGSAIISGLTSDCVATQCNNSNAEFYPAFVCRNNTSGQSGELLYTGSGLHYNPYAGTLTADVFVGNLAGNASTATGTSAYNRYCLESYSGSADRSIVISDADTSQAKATVATLGRSTNCKLTFNPNTGVMCRRGACMHGYGITLPSANGGIAYALIDAGSCNNNVIEGTIWSNAFAIAKTCSGDRIYRFSCDNYGSPAAGYINNTSTCFWLRYGAWVQPELFAKDPIKLVCSTTTAPSGIEFIYSVSESVNATVSNTACFVSACGNTSCGVYATVERSNELNIYSIYRQGWINHRGGVSCLFIGNGTGTDCYGTVTAATFCGNLCGQATCAYRVCKCVANNNDLDVLLTYGATDDKSPVWVSANYRLRYCSTTGALRITRSDGTPAGSVHVRDICANYITTCAGITTYYDINGYCSEEEEEPYPRTWYIYCDGSACFTESVQTHVLCLDRNICNYSTNGSLVIGQSTVNITSLFTPDLTAIGNCIFTKGASLTNQLTGNLAIGKCASTGICCNVRWSTIVTSDDSLYGRHGRISVTIPSCNMACDTYQGLRYIIANVINAGRCTCTWSTSTTQNLPNARFAVFGYWWDDGGSTDGVIRWAPGVNIHGSMNTPGYICMSQGAACSPFSISTLLYSCTCPICIANTAGFYPTNTNRWQCGMEMEIVF